MRFCRAIDAEYLKPLFQERLQRLLGTGTEVHELYITRVFPGRNESFTIQYSLYISREAGRSPEELLLGGHLFGESEGWPAPALNYSQRTMVFDDLRLIVPIFPYDPGLPAIAEAYQVDRIPEIIKPALKAINQENPEPELSRLEVLGYRPGRRCVLRYNLRLNQDGVDESEEFQIVLRMVRPKKIKRILESMALLGSGGFDNSSGCRLRAPEILYVDKRKGVYIMKSAPGASLHELMGHESFIPGCARAAELLLKLHCIKPKGALDSRDSELVSLRENLDRIGTIYPEMAADFRSTFQAVAEVSTRISGEFVNSCVHRDFYDKQVLFSEDQATLLDFDSLSYGDPAQDYGNFIAHLELRKLQEPAYAANIEMGRKRFEIAYENASEKFRFRARWWQSATSLRLAALYALRPRWHSLTSNLLQLTLASLPVHTGRLEGVNESIQN